MNELIEERIADRQLDECDLTLGELKVIAERFRFTLMTMLHSRIAYPKPESKFLGTARRKFAPDVMAATQAGFGAAGFRGVSDAQMSDDGRTLSAVRGDANKMGFAAYFNIEQGTARSTKIK